MVNPVNVSVTQDHLQGVYRIKEKIWNSYIYGSRDSVVNIATGYGLADRRTEFESRYGQELPLPHVDQTDSWAHPVSYSMVTGGSFPVGKEAGVWSQPLTSN
jgi:hypothetical protein